MENRQLPDLNQFSGTEHWYRHPLNRSVLYTDGARYVAEQAGAYWLLDAIALAQLQGAVKAEPFQVWELVVSGSGGVLTCGDGNGTPVYRQALTLTDFPEPGVTLWLTDGVILLPSEY